MLNKYLITLLITVLFSSTVMSKGNKAGLSGGLIGQAIGELYKPSKQQVEDILIKSLTSTAKTMNSSLPRMVDEGTRLDKVTVGPGVLGVYHHTLVAYTSKQIDKRWLYKNLQPIIINNVCANKDMKLSLQYGTKFRYTYSGNDKIRLIDINVDRLSCGYKKIHPK